MFAHITEFLYIQLNSVHIISTQAYKAYTYFLCHTFWSANTAETLNLKKSKLTDCWGQLIYPKKWKYSTDLTCGLEIFFIYSFETSKSPRKHEYHSKKILLLLELRHQLAVIILDRHIPSRLNKKSEMHAEFLLGEKFLETVMLVTNAVRLGKPYFRTSLSWLQRRRTSIL